MPSLVTVTNGSSGDEILAEHINQLVELLQGLRNIPASLTGINDNSNFALTLRNAGTGGRGLNVLDSAGATKFAVQDSGVTLPSATALTSPAITGTVTGGAIYTAPHFTSPVVDSGGLVVSTSDITGRRYRGAGTALVAGDFVLSAGWGSTATVVVATGSTDARGQITVTPSGAGIGANPTITMTYKDGTWTNAPFPIVARQGGSGASADLATTASTATLLVIQYLGTPVSGLSQVFSWQAVG